MIDYNNLLPKIIGDITADKSFDCSKLPYNKTIIAGALFTDVKGFTKMTEIVSKGGHYSVEIITELLNTYFDAMYHCIDNYDGDLIKFGGDSILAIFPGDQESAENRMIACLLEMKKSLIKLNEDFMKTYSLEIDFHGNMSWGEVEVNIVGSRKHHLDYFLTGEAMKSLFAKDDMDFNILKDSKAYFKKDKYDQKSNDCLDQFIPSKISEWLRNNKFKGELKNSSVIFVKVENKDNPHEKIKLETFQEFYLQLQDIVYFYEGTINKIDFTDKGYLILITFGVPYLHSDDIERAFISSSKISKLMINGVNTKIGLTYNNIFSGVLGARERYEYGIIGNGVNISARLMSESPYNDFNFSSEIIPHIQGRYETEYIKNVKVKGIAEKIEIYHVTNELSDYWNALSSNYAGQKLFGYEDVLTKMANSLLTYVSGSTGSGKSHLVYEFLKPIVEQKRSNVIFIMSEYDKLNPFTLFYKLINRHIAIDNIGNQINELKMFLEEKHIKLDLDIVADYFNENSSEIKEKTIPVVYDILTEIIVAVLKNTDVIVIENIQWFDQQSHKLLLKMIPKLKVEEKQVILTANDKEICLDYGDPTTLKVEMKEFDERLTKEFFHSKKLIVTTKAIKEILLLSQSNPAYIKEISEIIEENWLESKGVFDASDFQQLVREEKLPNSFETVLLNDFESLDAETKRLLKYASIIGVSFSKQLLDIFPEEFVQEHIERVLGGLTTNKHIFKKIILPEIEYFFNNSLMRDAIYRTILFKEKQKLHIIIANYYQNYFQEKISIYYEVIANHYILAKSHDKSIKWCLLAAQKNYEHSAYAISDYYYTQAFRVCSEKKQGNDILLSLLAVNIPQNKISEVSSFLKKIDIALLSQEQLDLYYFYKIRLYEKQRDFKQFNKTFLEIRDLIHSEEILFRIKLILFDYYRTSNSLKEFESLKNELGKTIETQSVTIEMLYYSVLGQFYLDRADYSLAEENYLKLSKIAAENEKRLYIRISATSLGIIQIRQGNQEEALVYFQKALNIAEDIGDKHGYAKVNTEIAMIYFAQGLDDKAISSLTNCLSTAKYIGDKQQEQTVLYNFGYIYSILQEYNTAIDYLNKARDIAVIIDDKMGVAYANDGLGDAYFLLKKFALAKEVYEDNLKLQKELQDKEGVAHTVGNLANVLREEKNYPKALEYYQVQFNSLHEIGDKVGEGKALFNWGITFEILGDNQNAVEKLTDAYKLFTEAKDKNYADFTEEQIERIKNKK